MKHDELARIALRTLAYAELSGGGAARDQREVLALLTRAVGHSPEPPAAEAALNEIIAALGAESAEDAADMPAFLRGSMRYV